MNNSKKKICFVVSFFATSGFIKKQVELLSKEFEVYLVANFSNESEVSEALSMGFVDCKKIEIERNISILKDMKAVITLFFYFRKMKFFSVHSITPKAGLITALASRLSSIKNRIHIFTGQVWASREGVIRKLLKACDTIIAKLNTQILVDGNSQREFLIEQNIISKEKSNVLANGSIAGVDIEKFNRDDQKREETRNTLGIDHKTFVFLFLGRLCKDKGLDELIAAFTELYKYNKNVFLLLGGYDEGNYKEILETYPGLKRNINYYYNGVVSNPQDFLSAADAFCLPSYREGFGVSVIEASASNLPVIVSDTYGLRDAIIPEVTGLICKVRSAESLYGAMKYLFDNQDYSNLLGDNGRRYISKNFNQKIVCDAWLDFYANLN